MGAEQHGNLSSVGFDLFTQMLGEAVSEARGAVDGELEASEVTINLPADFFLAEEYLPDVDRRVLVYRKLAGAAELSEIDTVEHETEQRYGSLPAATKNLFDRARIRIRAQRLGVTMVSLTNGRLMYQGLVCSRDLTLKFKERGALVYPKTKKVAYPFHRGSEDIVMSALAVLEEAGGDDEALDE